MRGSILKIEKINFDPETKQRRQLWCVSIAAKRYALFYFDAVGNPVIPPKGHTRHGLGYLLDPGDPEEPDDPEDSEELEDGQTTERARWERALWESMVHERLGLTHEPPPWLERPAVMRLTISSPWHLAPFRRFNAGKPYAEQIKPFNFLLSARLADVGRPTAVAPGVPFRLVGSFETNARKWLGRRWTDVYSSLSYRVTTAWPGGGDNRAGIASLGSVAAAYPFHPESKRSGSDGLPCQKQADGLLSRRRIHGAGTICIGKEAHRLEDRGLVTEIDELINTFTDSRRDPWIMDTLPRLRAIAAEPGGRAKLLEVSGLKERALQNVISGGSHPRRTAVCGLKALANSYTS